MIKKHTKAILLLALGLLLNTVGTLNADEQTTVYKAVSDDGSISFSDEAHKGSEAITVKPITTIPAFDVKQNKRLSSEDKQAAEHYQSLSVISPSDDTAINTGSGNVQVIVQSIPRLRNSDLFELELDGAVVSSQRETTFNLKNVNRGTHTLSIKIINRNKQTLKIAISTITIHRPTSRIVR